MNPFYLTFDIVCDEIENRVFEASTELTDYSLNDIIPSLVDAFALDFPSECRKYSLAVIESMFYAKAETLLTSKACESREAYYMELESEYYVEATQLELF